MYRTILSFPNDYARTEFEYYYETRERLFSCIDTIERLDIFLVIFHPTPFSAETISGMLESFDIVSSRFNQTVKE